MGGAVLSDPVLAQLANNVTNPQYETDFRNLLTRLNTIGKTANSDRETLANRARTSAFDQGLSDETSVEELKRVAGDATLGTADAVTYKIKMGPDGRAYRQAYLNTGANFGARNWTGGSEEKAAQWKARQDLNSARDTLTDNLSTSQNASVIKQGTDEGDTMGDIAKNVTDYGAWKVEKTPQSPSGGATGGSGSSDAGGDTQGASPAAKDPFRGIAVNGILGRYAKAPDTKVLDSAYKPGNYKVVKRGGNKGYVVVRTK